MAPSEKEWIEKAKKEGISDFFLAAVDLTSKDHKKTLYKKFGVEGDDDDKVEEQAYLLSFVKNFQAVAEAKRRLKADELVLASQGRQTAVPNPKSTTRGPIVVTCYSDTTVDKNRDDPQLKNARQDGHDVVTSDKDIDITSAQGILDEISTTLLQTNEKNSQGKTEGMEFLPEPKDGDSLYALYTQCLQSSSQWLCDNDSAGRVFDQEANEQLQMHLGGSCLMLYPLLFASEGINSSDTTKADLCADRDWDSEEVLTHTDYAQRLKLKLKADAWLKISFGSGFIAPIFHFEHKTKNQGGRAHRKAVLDSQLAWRRIFLAACADSTKVEYEETLQEASEKCKDILIWFASLEGSQFRVGALRGQYDKKKPQRFQATGGSDQNATNMRSSTTSQAITTYASFNYLTTDIIDVIKNGEQAMNLMYALSLHLPLYVKNSPEFLLRAKEDHVKEGQDFSKAAAGSKRKMPPKEDQPRSKDRSGSNKKVNDGRQHVKSRGAPAGMQKLACTRELLGHDVSEIATLWAVPSDAYFEEAMPFEGDHIFSGTWIGDEKLAPSRSGVVLKAFSGAEELEDFHTEVKILEVIKDVPHVQELIISRKAEHINFAVIVSPIQPTTAWHVKTLNDLKEVGGQVLEALADLHRLGIIHRDVKPSNILWFPARKKATLIDFGLATKATVSRVSPREAAKFHHIISSTGNVGTKGYQAPEVLAGCHYDGKIDVFSLGKSICSIALDANIGDDADSSLEQAVNIMTKSDPSERCTVAEALDLPFFAERTTGEEHDPVGS